MTRVQSRSFAERAILIKACSSIFNTETQRRRGSQRGEKKRVSIQVRPAPKGHERKVFADKKKGSFLDKARTAPLLLVGENLSFKRASAQAEPSSVNLCASVALCLKYLPRACSKICFYLLTLPTLLILFSNSLGAQEGPTVTLDLNHPCYENGVLTTHEGGVLCAEDLRIQACTLVYTKQEGVHTVFAEKNLLIDYQEYALVGNSLFFDFNKNEGCLIEGKTGFAPWYIGGEKIILCESGDILIHNGYITSSEGGEEEVMLEASTLLITRDKVVKATCITFKIKETPLLSLPFFELDLNTSASSPFSATVGWGGFLGGYISLRYHFLSFRNWDAYLRLDGYMDKGFGGGVETEYLSELRQESFFTRSYYAHDISIDDPKKKERYRFQGTYDFTAEDGQGWAQMRYDLLSDPEMANDFPPYDFELGTAARTELILHRHENFWAGNLTTRVRVNSFQTMNQELPAVEMHLHPWEIAGSGIIGESLFRAGYLSYVFSSNVEKKENFHAGRLEVHPRLYRPFYFNPVKVVPEIGWVGIAYSNGPEHRAVGQSLMDANLLINTQLSNAYGFVKHAVTPYLHYHLLSAPRAAVDNYYVFTIKDGYTHLNLVKFGTRHAFFLYPLPPTDYHLFIDLWSNAFIHAERIPEVIQKGYFEVELQPHPFMIMGCDGAWNFQHSKIDFFNTYWEATISADLALGVEYRHRSAFDWRKADFYNFVLEAARSEEELLLSTLSDQRDIVLGRIFYRFHPEWDAKLQFRRGWNRLEESKFFEYQIDLGKTIFHHYHIGLMYERKQDDHRYSVSFKLGASPP